MKKPRTGGSGASRVPLGGEPVMAWGNAITLAYALTGSLCRLFCLIEGEEAPAP